MKNESIINHELYHKVKGTKSKIDKEIKHMPNQKYHKYVSFLKSSVRITGYGALMYGIGLGVFILIISELIGIIEELV